MESHNSISLLDSLHEQKQCPVTGLKFTLNSKWTRIKLNETYSVSFALIGDRILYTIPEGFCGQDGLTLLLEKKDLFLEVYGLTNKRYAEIKNYTFIREHNREGIKQFRQRLLLEREKGLLLGYWGFNAEYHIKYLFNARMWQKKPVFPVFIVNDYKTAVRNAVQTLKGDGINLTTDPNRLTDDTWYLKSNGYSTSMQVIQDNIIFSKAAGTLEYEHVASIFTILQKVYLEANLDKCDDFYLILDWSDLQFRSWSARFGYLKQVRSLDLFAKCSGSVLVGLNNVMKLIVKISSLLIPFKLYLAATIDDGLEIIANMRMNRSRGHHDFNLAIISESQNKEQIDRLLSYIGSIDWDEAGISSLESDKKISREFKPLFEAISLIKHDFDEAIRQNKKTGSQLDKQNRFNALRADIWKIAADLSLSQEVLIKRLLDKVGETIGFSRACYNSFEEEGNEKSNLVCEIEWCAPGVRPSLGTKIPNVFVKNLKSKEIFHLTVESAAQLLPKILRPSALLMMKAITIPLNIESWAVLPFVVKGESLGWFTFDVCKNNPYELEITNDIKDIIQETVEIVSRHLAFQQAEEALQQVHAELEERVRKRTAQLAESNCNLQKEIDIRVQTEIILKDSEEKYRSLFNSIADPIIIFNKDSFNFLNCNEAFTRIYGFTMPELINMTPFDFHPPEDIETFKKNIGVRSQEGANKYTHLTREGRQITVEIITDEIVYQGQPAWISIIRDITEQEKNYKVVEKSQAILNTIINSMPVAVMIVGRDKKIRQVNKAALQLAGYQKETELLNRACYETLCFSDVDKCPLLDLGQNLDRSERSLLTREGKVIPVLKSALPIELNGEQVILETFIDITEIHEARLLLEVAKSEAENANRMKSRFLANISHEIRTPLNAIIGFSEIMCHSTDLKQTREQAGIILDESETLLYLINSILDHAKIEAGKLDLEILTMNIKSILGQIVTILSSQALKKGLEFKLHIADNVPDLIKGDPVRLKQVLLNLADNALKFTKQGRVDIFLNCLESNSCSVLLEFIIKDTGIGIAYEKQDIIFNSFTQADGSTTREYGGTGLGITISKELVLLMGGKIGLESTPGKGTTFWFELKFDVCKSSDGISNSIPEVVINSCLSGPVVTSANYKILAAEDYLPNQEVLRIYLESADFEIDITDNGKVALDLAAKKTYDLVLLDVQMPVMGGYETALELRKLNDHYSKVSIIAMTAHADTSSKQACLDVGMDAVITKPIRREKMIKTIYEWLEGADRKNENRNELVSKLASDEVNDRILVPFDKEIAINEFGTLDLVLSVMQRFQKTAHKQIKDMISALDQSDFEFIKKEAHSIKGGAAVLAAMPLSQAAGKLEQSCKTDNISEIRSQVFCLEKFFKELDSFIEQIIKHRKDDE